MEETPLNLRALEVGHTELLRCCVSQNIRRREKPAPAGRPLVRDRGGGIRQGEVEHVLICNTRFPLEECG